MLQKRPHSRSRGFTLVELLIAITMLGILSGLALMSWLQVIHAAQSAEARTVLGQIKSGEEAYRVEMLNYLSVSGSMTDYYPNATPNDTKWAWNRPADSRFYRTNPLGGWQLLGVNPDGPVRYGYVVMAGVAPTPLPALDSGFTSPPTLATNLAAGTPWFVAGARNEHYKGQTGKPSIAVTTSYDGTVYWENEGN
jgi:type IV pilus assembly protein PilA